MKSMQRSEVVTALLSICEVRLGKKGRVIDLGAGHCQFTLLSHKLGWTATALDARTTRRPVLPQGVRYVEGSVNSEMWSPADYDVILCLGLYYHLDQKMQFDLLKRCQGKHLILDTHYSHSDGRTERFKSTLGPIETQGSEKGSWFVEVGAMDDQTRQATAERASFENRQSWWPTRTSLINTLRAHGWPDVWIVNQRMSDNLQRSFFYCPGS